MRVIADHCGVTVDWLLGHGCAIPTPSDPAPIATRELPAPYHCAACAEREEEIARWRQLCDAQAAALKAQAETIKTLFAGVCHYPTTDAPATPTPRASSRAS